MTIAVGHSGTLASCPACAERDGWAQASGLGYAAQVIWHEAESEDDLDLATLCEYVAEAHRPDVHGRCAECGELWLPATEFPNLGGLRCSAYVEAQQLKNEWLAGRVRRIVERWAR
ncbi:hypothetical protein [Gordonia oryzae]|uniref:hypothetical protein n=1 Tax=Gordonia oryzae TaxID=2487349 RepID=UPI00161BA379|nr:hypothetical protein [Gordonia oryzae]